MEPLATAEELELDGLIDAALELEHAHDSIEALLGATARRPSVHAIRFSSRFVISGPDLNVIHVTRPHSVIHSARGFFTVSWLHGLAPGEYGLVSSAQLAELGQMLLAEPSGAVAALTHAHVGFEFRRQAKACATLRVVAIANPGL